MYNSELDSLRTRVRSYMGERRWQHTLGVAETAYSIGAYFPSVDRDRLIAAALLHDVAKEMSTDDQRGIIKEFAVAVSDEDMATLPALHSFAAVALIKRDFPEFAHEDILSAVCNHTLGAADMTLFDKIIYVSDYIEPGRTSDACRAVGDALMSSLADADEEGNTRALNRAVVASIDNTRDYLSAKGQRMNSRSLAAKDALSSLI